MRFGPKLILLALTSAVVSFANTVVFTGPSASVIGDPLAYQIWSVQITQPTSTVQDWSLIIQSNYGAPIPGSTDVVPAYLYGNGQGPYGFGDLLITWNNHKYGVVITPHDGYVAGALYQVNDFQTSLDVMGQGNTPRGSEPVLIGLNGQLLGTGNLSGAKTGNGTTTPMYTITDLFSAPAGFLGAGSFSIEISSYVCANGYIIGTDDFIDPVPEPGTFLLLIPGIALLAGWRFRQSKRNTR